MKRLVQILFVAIWLAGAVTGELEVRPSNPIPQQTSMPLLVDTDHARLGVDQNRVVIAIETPWHAAWRVSAPMPEHLAPNRPEAPRHSPSESDAQPSTVSLLIRFLASLP